MDCCRVLQRPLPLRRARRVAAWTCATILENRALASCSGVQGFTLMAGPQSEFLAVSAAQMRCRASLPREVTRRSSAAKLRHDLPAEHLNPVTLVPADVVQVDAVETQIDEALDLGPVGIRVG